MELVATGSGLVVGRKVMRFFGVHPKGGERVGTYGLNHFEHKSVNIDETFDVSSTTSCISRKQHTGF